MQGDRIVRTVVGRHRTAWARRRRAGAVGLETADIAVFGVDGERIAGRELEGAGRHRAPAPSPSSETTGSRASTSRASRSGRMSQTQWPSTGRQSVRPGARCRRPSRRGRPHPNSPRLGTGREIARQQEGIGEEPEPVVNHKEPACDDSVSQKQSTCTPVLELTNARGLYEEIHVSDDAGALRQRRSLIHPT